MDGPKKCQCFLQGSNDLQKFNQCRFEEQRLSTKDMSVIVTATKRGLAVMAFYKRFCHLFLELGQQQMRMEGKTTWQMASGQTGPNIPGVGKYWEGQSAEEPG